MTYLESIDTGVRLSTESVNRIIKVGNKPRIYRDSGEWWCVGLSKCGLFKLSRIVRKSGNSPETAFNNWVMST